MRLTLTDVSYIPGLGFNFYSVHAVLFDPLGANAHTGKRGEGGVGSKDNEVLDAYGRDTLNDNGERVLTFAANHGLALVNTFFSTCKWFITYLQRLFSRDSIIVNLLVT